MCNNVCLNKSEKMTTFWFWIFLTFTILNSASSQDMPKFTLLANVASNNYANFTCVADTTMQDSGLTFITPLENKFVYTESKYFSANGEHIADTYDCKTGIYCPQYSEWASLSGLSAHVFQITTGQNILSPVRDERWEKFNTYFSPAGQYLQYDFNRIVYNIGISVRTTKHINVLLYKEPSYWSSTKYYSVYIGGSESAIEDCGSGRCSNLYRINKKVLTTSPIYWNHIQIILSENQIIIRNSNKELLQYNLNKPLDITRIDLAGDQNAMWKIHDYSYLSIPWLGDPTSWSQIGPSVTADAQGFLCVSLYVATCSSCSMRFRLSLDSEDIRIKGNSDLTQLPEWQYVRLKVNGRQNKSYRLQFQVNGGKNGFWLIDGIRRCYDGEIKVVSMAASINNYDVISCQALKSTNTLATLRGGLLTSPNLDVCNNASYTGSQCQVPCTVAPGGKCRGTIVCETGTINKCSCAAGYQGDRCQEDCNDGNYGSRCRNTCSPCKNFCEKTTGDCSALKACGKQDTDPGCLFGNMNPRNINITWNEGKVKIVWDHPQASIGDANFSITIDRLSTELSNSEQFTQLTYSVTGGEENYVLEITDPLPPSSKYLVRVRVGSGEAFYEFSTPVASPRFVGALALGTHQPNTQVVLVPAPDSQTLTRSSSIFIFVCNVSSTENDLVIKNETHGMFHNLTGCTGASWIAGQIQISTQTVNFTVGDISNYPENKPLTEDSIYNISVIVVNVFEGKVAYAISSVSTADTHGGSAVILAVILLVIFLFLLLGAGLIWWKLKRTPKKSNMSVTYQAVNNKIDTMVTVSNDSEANSVQNGNNILFESKENNENDNHQQNGANDYVNNENEIQVELPFSKAVDVSKFSTYVKKSIQNKELKKQFDLLPEGQTKKCEIGLLKNNVQKNRYKNLTAYDHSRVILEKLPGDPYSDFINANYIDGYNQKNAYIATQGPKQSTTDDFWRMIWQEKVKCIVMMTNLIEEGKQKCQKYWPEIDNSETYGEFLITCLKVDIYADYEYRTFEIVKDNISRKIQQYHFTSWPDHGVPMYPQSLVPFLNKLLIISPAQAPIVVHCSAGIGRTGTIILCDICLRMAASEKKIDVLKYFHSMREQRSNMVAKYDQYELVHMVLLESLLTSNTNYPCNTLQKHVDDLLKTDGIKKQMQYLCHTAWYYQTMKEYINEPDDNKAHNRFSEIVPRRRRIHLSRTGYDSSDYINAVPVDGFRNKGQFIVTQNPLPHTIKDFWKMILDFNVKDVVSLNELMLHDVTNIKFWPTENEPMTPLPYLKVLFVSKSDENAFEYYKLKLIDSRNQTDDGPYHVNILHLKNWTYEQLIPTKETDLIALIESVPKLPRVGSPIVVTCYDGARASGLYVALSFVIEKIKLEQACDVCLAVRTVRNNREQFVTDIEQFEFLYKAALMYISSFETYSNFN